MQKYLPILLFVATLGSLVVYPVVSPTLGINTLLLSLAFSTYAIYAKHKGTEYTRTKILKDVGVMVITLIIVIFLGGVIAMLANAQVSGRWGEVVGLISAVAVSFAMGYFVRKGMMRLVS